MSIVEQSKDKIVESVRVDLLERSKKGQDKYGTTLDRKDLDLSSWLQHAYEECLDQALYLKRAIKEVGELPVCEYVKRYGESCTLNNDCKYPDCTRVEVITKRGRAYGMYNCKSVQTSIQDEGRTLKVFIS